MASLVVGSATFTVLSGASATTGKFWTACKPGNRFKFSNDIEIPGVNGMPQKWFGFRGRIMVFGVFYKNTTQTAVLSAWEADANALDGILFSVTPPGLTEKKYCKLLDNGFPCGEVFNLLTGGYGMQTFISCKQVRES